MNLTVFSILWLSLLVYGVSLLTFFSGFGLGTLLLPAIALFVSIEEAIIYTAIIHFLNNLWKCFLLWRSISFKIVFLFGLPAILGAVLGAYLLVQFSEMDALFSYQLFGHQFFVRPIEVFVGAIMIVLGLSELIRVLKTLKIPSSWIPVGGVISGFFGGLAGLQGAFRSYFLINLGLDKYTFIASSAFIAFLVDFSRITVYLLLFKRLQLPFNIPFAGLITVAAFLGVITGNKLLKKVEMDWIHKVVAVLLILFGILLSSGII